MRSEVLLHALEEKNIYVSAGSACSSNKKLPVSAVLKEIHLERDLLETTVRFSFCESPVWNARVTLGSALTPNDCVTLGTSKKSVSAIL